MNRNHVSVQIKYQVKPYLHLSSETTLERPVVQCVVISVNFDSGSLLCMYTWIGTCRWSVTFLTEFYKLLVATSAVLL